MSKKSKKKSLKDDDKFSLIEISDESDNMYNEDETDNDNNPKEPFSEEEDDEETSDAKFESDDDNDTIIDDCIYNVSDNDDGDDDEKEKKYVLPNERITKPVLFKYERVRLIGDRAKQLSLGAKPMIKNAKHLSSKTIFLH